MAGSTIKGISIEFGANTQALTAALADVNQKSRNLQGELSQVQRLLRMDPGNTTLIAQQQQLLGQAVNNSREKLDRLKAAQEQVNEQFRRGDINEAQWRSFQREVAASEQQLQRFEEQLQQVNQTSDNLTLGDKFKTSVSGVADNVKNIISPATLAAGAVAGIGIAAVGVVAQGVNMASSWDQASRQMAAATGLPMEAMGEFEAQAEIMFGNARGSVDEIYAAMTQVQQVFHGSAEETGALADKALVLQQVFGFEVSESIKSVDSLVKNFGIDGNTAFDIITKTSQMAGDKAGDLLDTFNEYSPQFAAMGFSAEEFAGILVKGAQEGAFNLDKVGDAVKEFNIRAQDGSKTTAEGFAAIGLNADEMGAAIAAGGDKAQAAFEATIAGLAAIDDPMKQNQAGAALFGEQWNDVRSKVITAMADGKTALGDFAGATDDAAGKVDGGFGQAMERLKNKFGLVTKEIGEKLAPVLNEMATWIEDHMPEIQATVETAFNVMGKVIEGLTLPIRNIIALLQGDFDQVMENTLHLWGISWDGVKSKGLEVWNSITTGVKNWWSGITSWLSSLNPWGAVSGAWNTFKTNTIQVWSNLVTDAKSWGKNIVQGLWQGISSMGTTLRANVTEFINQNIPEVIRKLLGIHSPSTVAYEIGAKIEDADEKAQLALIEIRKFMERWAVA
ncbi:phage tail tape measure protein [Desulfoscipio gibsoniae]|uniref:Phage-related minor tail protein n=1 Tax=Desulfoscipio gibsoniae DSM 7213 TaxID=767817 RepID=R4KJ43_9FIRM|nr:phage tail tape measure protein [Desulfoscipio gibsoniae]AGK99655.1 Phage-related minor tail protein [Desulfoscipio gibsoniae DSM 7213]